MKKLSLLLLLLGSFANAQINLPPVPPYAVCDSNADGYADFLLQTHVPEILDGLSSADYTVSFYLTQADADAAVNALPNLFTNTTPYQQTLFVKVTENDDPATTTVTTLDLIVQSAPVVNTPSAYALCEMYPGIDAAVFDLTTKISEITNGNNELSVNFYETYNDAVSDLNPIANPQTYYTISPGSQTVYVGVTNPSPLATCGSIVPLTLQIIPLPQIEPLPFIYECDGIYNLTDIEHLIDPDFTVTYYVTHEDAVNEANTVVNVSNYAGNAANEIWIRVTDETTGCPLITSTYLSDGIIDLADARICVDFTSNETISDYTFETYLDPAVYSFAWFKEGIVIPDATDTSYTATVPGTYHVTATRMGTNCVTESNDFHLTQSGPAVAIGSGVIVSGQNIQINAEGYGTYRYFVDGGNQQVSNLFYNLSLGTHTATVYDVWGCGSLEIQFVILIPNPPTGAASQDFTEGQTLANLVVEGENILWYSGAAAPPSALEETPLPATTLLTDGTTYYATQTINGIESTARLAVTVHSILGLKNNTFSGLQYYPNPAENILHIDNNSEIGNIIVFNLLGQPVLSAKNQGNSATLNIDSLAKGMYLLTISSNGQHITVKFTKK